MMRLDKYLSERLGIPRGESRKLAAKGRVTAELITCRYCSDK